MDAGARFGRLTVQAATLMSGDLSAAAARAIVAMLWMSSLALVARRLAGALIQPLNPGPLLVATTVVILAAAGARLLWLRWGFRATNRSIVAHQAMLSVAVLLFAAAVSLPDVSAASLTIAWIAVIGGETIGWTASWRRWGAASWSAPSAHSVPRFRAPSGERVEQQLIYSRGPTGDVLVRGLIAVSFAAGQRTATSHVAFCPPLAATPTIEFNQTAGPSVRTRLGLVVPWGVRFDLKLDAAPSNACDVRLEFRAHPSPIGPSGRTTDTGGNPPPSRSADDGR